MKTNFYILFILLLSFSLGNAQSTNEVVSNDTNVIVSVSNETEVSTVKNDSLLIDASQINETIARSSSDIRVYLNRKRKVSNINLLFREMNKATRA
ncbi:hypothetical protein FPF71_09530 [Algibacter amylolyticus]|uniref:Uncharacterized protein n=1 Tax=Algibacter amylolyticus TaxID=1608400 RepID=A0A5M7B6T3_9FLAO|nr:hypothetical protein [Algibacter amylolyticus]KAA5824410.1 hypothetical protein F2B50_09530 [Algibacter amylolyticus]MBB5269532.1 hypothetical protein [Algibacter amylolyticus]TSJ75183.1 hypothetical protein FPF71_09530 [Algibacter amylolyticus]